MTRRASLVFLGLGVAWGIPYLLIKVAVEQLTPAQLVFARTAMAAVLLLPIAGWRRELLCVLRRWPPLLAFVAVEIAIPWLLLSSAERRLPSSITGLLIAAVPLIGVAVAFVTGRAERMGRSGWAGLCVGFAGVAALVGLDIAGSNLGAVGELAIVAVCYALGPVVLTRWLSDLPSLGVIAAALGISALVYIPVVALDGGVPAAMPATRIVVSVVLLAVVCTAAAFMMLFILVAEIGPVRATTITYLNPAVAIAAGALVLGEQISGWTIVGFVLVLAGSYLVNRRPGRNRPESDAGEPSALSGVALPERCAAD